MTQNSQKFSKQGLASHGRVHCGTHQALLPDMNLDRVKRYGWPGSLRHSSSVAAALLVFLPAAAGAGIVSADLRHGITDRVGVLPHRRLVRVVCSFIPLIEIAQAIVGIP